MLKYTEKNVNPSKHKTGDCSTRAIAGTLGISWEDAFLLQVRWTLIKHYSTSNKETVELVLKDFGYVKMKQPRKPDGTKYMVCELDKIISPEIRAKGVLVTVANHHTCIIGDAVQDIWDCRRKTVGNYYIKP